MTKIILMLAVVAMTMSVYAQTDTINKKMMPPEINNTDGVNKTEWNNPNNGRGTIDNRPKNDQTPTRKDNNNSDSTSHKKDGNHKFTDGYVMQNGKMMYSKNGKLTPMDKNYTYPNGTILNTDGTYISPQGKKRKLGNGQHLDNSGTMVPNN